MSIEKVRMYNKEGMLISKEDGTPFKVIIQEWDNVLKKYINIPFENGDKLEIVREEQ